MYNEFIKKITANLAQYMKYEDVVENADLGIVDDAGNNITQDVRDIIDGNKKLDANLAKYLIKSKTATLQYLGKNPDRNANFIQYNPHFADAYLSNINFSLYYIGKVLGNDITKNTDFVSKLKNGLLKKRADLIPIYMYVTGDIDDDLLEQFISKYAGKERVVEHFSLVKDFLIALQQHNKLNELYESGKIKSLLENFKANIHHGINTQDSKNNTQDSKNNNQDSENNNQVIKAFNLDISKLGEDTRNFFNYLNNKSNDVLMKLDYDNDISTIVNDFIIELNSNAGQSGIDSFKKELLDKKGILESKYINILNKIKALDNGNKFVEFFNTLLSKIKTARLRGKKMFRLSKAYTRYYIKNVLAYKVKANNDPEVLPQVIKVSTDEIQDLMYGDSIKHPENLSEIQNPEAKKQIFNDVEDAVEKISKGDLLEDGAADGMSIEDLAKKWAPMYNMQYEQMLDILKTQEQAGSIVEQEHTDNLEIAKEIARDHLTEAPDYYTHLENMESLFPDENVAVKPLMEPENMDLKTVSPQPEDSDHVCDGSCGGNCKCNDKVKTVEDKIQDLSGDGIMVVMVSDSPEVIEEQPLDFIQQIAAKMKE